METHTCVWTSTYTNAASVSFYPSPSLSRSLSLSLCFAHSPLSCFFPSSIFSLSPRGVEDPHHNQSWWSHRAQQRTQGTVQISWLEKRRKRGEGEVEKAGSCILEEEEEREGALGSLHSQRVGTLSAREGRQRTGEPIPLVKPPMRPGPSQESCACIQMWAWHWYSPPVLLLLLLRSASFFLIRGLFIDTPVNVSPNFAIVLSPLPWRFICRSVRSSVSTSLWALPSSPPSKIWPLPHFIVG